MSVYNLKYWNEEETFYTQENNPTEVLLKKLFGKVVLESCGPTAAANLVASLVRVRMPIIVDGNMMDQESKLDEVIMDYFNTPDNYKKFDEFRKIKDLGKYPFNEIPQFYPWMFKDMFGLDSDFYMRVSWNDIRDAVEQGYGVIVCMKNPGHYVAIGQVDTDKGTVQYRDSWKGNYYPKELKGTGGFNREMKWSKLVKNLKPFFVRVGRNE